MPDKKLRSKEKLTSHEEWLIWLLDKIVWDSKSDLIKVLNAEPRKYIIPLANWLTKKWKIFEALNIIENCVNELIENPSQYPEFLHDIKALHNKQVKLRKLCIEYLISEQKYSVAREYILMELNSICVLDWGYLHNWYNWKGILDENKQLRSEIQIDKINLPRAKWFKDKLKEIEPMIPKS